MNPVDTLNHYLHAAEQRLKVFALSRGASVAALTVYDMLKAIDKGMRIGPILLQEKSGGKSGTWLAPPTTK